MKPKSLYGSICYTDLKEALKNAKISAKKVSTQKGEKIYVDVNIWINDEPDQFSNNASIQIQYKKEYITEKDKPYIGNLRFMEAKTEEAKPEDLAKLADDNDDDLQF